MVSGDPAATRQLVRVALRCAGVRGVLLGDPAADPSDEHVHVVADSPHTWLLPHTAAVVHHGGAGTTGAGLRAGVPNVICPWFADQPLWAERVHALGAGPRPVPPDASPPWRWATPSPRLSATPPCVRKPPRSAARSRPSAA
jgi:UDP:flavonoid glycosyltransferase YjiC (YdhE family)